MAGSGALAGRSAVITGASHGIGAECARVLYAEGARLALIARDLDRMVADVVTPMTRPGVSMHAFRCDLSDAGAVELAVAQIRDALGDAPDIIVNNAARFMLAPVERTPIEQLEHLLSVNLVAPFALVHAFLPDMRKRGRGHIVNIGSVADHRAFRGNAAYGASKYGLRGLHEVLRAELRGSGVRATLISPGHTDTAIWDAIDADTMKAIGPRDAMLSPHAVADAVRYAVTTPLEVNVDEIRVSRA